MGFPEDIEGIKAALAVIVLGIIAFIILVRRRPSPELFGFAACGAVQPTASTLAMRLFGQPPHSVFQKRAADRDVYLMFVAAGNSDTPDCVVGFADIRGADGTEDLVLIHSERPIPKLFRHVQGGVLEWAQRVEPISESLRPGEGWFWYARYGYTIKDVHVAKVLAQASCDSDTRNLLGFARLGAQVVVWASLAYVGDVLSRLEDLVCSPSNAGEDRRR